MRPPNGIGASLLARGARGAAVAALLALQSLQALPLGSRALAAGEVVVPVSLEGTWRWIEWNPRSDSGVRTPASARYERYLILREDETHEYWGRDSTGTYRLTDGFARVRDMAEVSKHAPRGAFLLEMANWNLQVAAFTARDTLILSPAGEPGKTQPIRRFVRLKQNEFKAPVEPMVRFRSLGLPHGVTYQEVEGQPDFYDRPPLPTFLQPASYPEFARDAGISGTVVLHVLVGSDGSVLNVRVVDRRVGLDDAARDAATKGTYTPATLEGRPVAAWTALAFRFDLP